MPIDPRPDVLDFLLARRSYPAKHLVAPYPDRGAIETLLQAASRTPDHGKLEPWRFAVLGPASCQRLADLAEAIGTNDAREPVKLSKQAGLFRNAGCIVAVISVPDTSAAVPVAEQQMSAAAVCMNLLNAAEASGIGAQWLTGWMATHRGFLTGALSLDAPDTVAGFIHLGTPGGTVPDRPRPDVSSLTTWVDA